MHQGLPEFKGVKKSLIYISPVKENQDPALMASIASRLKKSPNLDSSRVSELEGRKRSEKKKGPPDYTQRPTDDIDNLAGI